MKVFILSSASSSVKYRFSPLSTLANVSSTCSFNHISSFVMVFSVDANLLRNSLNASLSEIPFLSRACFASSLVSDSILNCTRVSIGFIQRDVVSTYVLTIVVGIPGVNSYELTTSP